ncbi:MAG: STT3 domain-containing protein [Thermoplasmatota archaeon]
MARRSRSSRTKAPKTKGKQAVKAKPKADAQVQGEIVQETEQKKPEKVVKEKKGGLSAWFKQNQNLIFILIGIFILAFLIRSYFYYQISFDTWPPRIVGNDPSYHKRVIDFVQSEGRHPIIDPLLNYPIGGGNPRPPIFDWSIAIVGLVLSPFFGFNVDASTWYVFQFAPTFWGALTIFPMYLLGKEAFGRKAGIMAAFFLALTASHIERSTLGFTDHDSFIVFFVVLAMYFLSKSFSVQKDRNYIEDWRKPESVILGFRSFFTENKEAVGYAVLTGLSIATIALTWQGYGYVMAILLIYFLVQLFLQRFRNEDSLGVFLIILIAIGITPLLSLPYYFVFSITIWSQGFYILLAMIMLGAFIVPTRDMPWLIVIPTLVLFLLSGYFLLRLGFPDTADLLFTGGGYFVTNKLYSTIAEAQAPDLSRVVFTYGPATFFLGLAGVVMAFIQIPKHLKKDYIFIVIWTGVAIYMALTAIRFTFNATPAFALLAGWVIVELVKFFKAEGLSIVYSIVALLVFLGFVGVTYESWDNFAVNNFLLLTILPIVLGSIGFFAYMKYRKHRENFKFRTILTALSVGFIVIFPNVLFAVDASIPYESKSDIDPDLEIFGSFGSSLHSEYWMDSYIWLSQQDTMIDGEYVEPEERPGFMSWWDYGFDELLLGKHPTAADNFQNGYQFTGSVIAAQNETEVISLMTARIIEGDFIENKRDFSDGMWDILREHLGDDDNSSLSAMELYRIYRNPAKYKTKVEGNPGYYGNYLELTTPNILYAAAKGVIMKLGKEGVVELYNDVTLHTEKSLRYFAVDYRLFPFSSSNTGIFYAPIKLADRDIDDYLEYRVYAQENTQGSNDNPVWTDYPDNPISMEKAEQEAERLGYKFRIREYDMYYTDAFYNSMFYKTYIGYSPEDVGQVSDGKSIPGMMGTSANLPPMQGWNMTHWMLAYRTMYYSEKDEANSTFPDDYTPLSSKKALDLYYDQGGDVKSGLGQGVFYLKYYHGAKVSGRVMTNRGQGAPGVRVTVLDEYGIAHGNVLTDINGRYEVIAPPGRTSILVTGGELSNEYDYLYQFQIDQSTSQPVVNLNSTQLEISDDLAMWRIDDGKIEQDFIIGGKTISGTVYWDLNEDGSFTSEDEPIKQGEITFVMNDYEDVVYGPTDIDEDGKYRISDLVPGKYTVIYTHENVEEELISNLNIDPSTDTARDLKMLDSGINGQILYNDGIPVRDSSVLLISSEGNVERTLTDPAGNYSFSQIYPGVYDVIVEQYDSYHFPVSTAISNGLYETVNITLYPVATLDMEVTSRGNNGGPASGALVRINDKLNASRVWTFTLDDDGKLLQNLPASLYDLHVVSKERDQTYTALAILDMSWLSVSDITVDLKSALRVNGTLTKLSDTPMVDTELSFQMSNSEITAHAYTNNNGEYEIYLPRGSNYRVIVDNKTEIGNVSYFHIQELEYKDKTGSVQLDIWADSTIVVRGKVYWDKDGNEIFTSSRDLQEMGDPKDLAAEFALANITVAFHHQNGTLAFKTIEEGMYEALLLPGKYSMEIDEPGFDLYKKEIIIEDSVANRNFGINGTDAPLVPHERDFELNISYQMIGTETRTMVPLANTDVLFIPAESYMEGNELTFTTDSEGKIRASLIPVEYTVVVDERYEDNGLEHKLYGNDLLFLDPSDKLLLKDTVMNHTVVFEGTMAFTQDSLLRYPDDASVLFNPVYGVGETLESTLTDENGRFQVELPAGYYILESHHERAGQNYLYLDTITIGPESGIERYMLKPAFLVDGTFTNPFNGIKNARLQFSSEDVWTSTVPDSSGDFQIFMFEGEYRIVMFFETAESIMGEDVPVIYYHNSSVVVEGPVFGLELELNKEVLVSGAVYYDANGDRTIEPTEKQALVLITFTPEDENLDPVTVSSDYGGDYEAMVPFAPLTITVETEQFKMEPKEGYGFLNLPVTNEILWDISLDPLEIEVSGTMFMDENDNDEYDDGDRTVKGLELTFSSEDHVDTVVTGDGGAFSIGLPPGVYDVSGFKYTALKPVYGYLGEINIDLGDNMTGLEWEAVGAGRYSGTAYLTDTDGIFHGDINSDETLTFQIDDGASIETEIRGGTFTVNLPHYTYTVSSSIARREYNIEMTYDYRRALTIDEDTVPADLSLEFEKSKTYTFTMELMREHEHELQMVPGQTVRIPYYIQNAGNEPIVVTNEVSEKPDGWTVDIPGGSEIEVGIGERIDNLFVNITAPSDPDWDNVVKFEAKTTEETTANFQISIVTPPSYGFELNFDADDLIGMDFDESYTFNLTVQNIGNGEDVVNVMMDPLPGTTDRWRIEWEGSEEFPEYGENASLTPRGQRRYAVTVHSPTETQSFVGDSLRLTFSGTNRIGDSETAGITLRLAEPNLILPQGYLKLTNRKLTDPILNRTVEANITVGSQNRAASLVNVTLLVDGKRVADGIIPSIPQDGYGSTRLIFNITEFNLTEDDFHTFEVIVDPFNNIKESNENDNYGYWDNVVIGEYENEREINWRIVIFVVTIILITVGIIAYKQRTEPI